MVLFFLILAWLPLVIAPTAVRSVVHRAESSPPNNSIVVDAQRMTEDDIPPHPRRRHKLSRLYAKSSMAWPDGRVPYVFDLTIMNAPASRRDRIREAMNLIEGETCVKFVKRSTERDYLLILDDGPQRCFSYVGVVGGAQEMSIGDGCDAQLGVIEHELMHALGIAHEQSRPDRDEFVTVVFDNIKKDRELNFAKYSPAEVYSLSVPYDYNSIMHYHRTAFTWNGRTTIRTTDKGAQMEIGQRLGMSACDIVKICAIYSCAVGASVERECRGGDTNTTTPPPTPPTCQESYPGCSHVSADPSLCDKFPGLYGRLCPLSCHQCVTPSPCIDSVLYASFCASRATPGSCEGETWSALVRWVCPLSCSTC